MKCNQCEMLNINGVNCHESGCPNVGEIQCENCHESVRRAEVCYANDWDGIKLCSDCAERQARFEAEECDRDSYGGVSPDVRDSDAECDKGPFVNSTKWRTK